MVQLLTCLHDALGARCRIKAIGVDSALEDALVLVTELAILVTVDGSYLDDPLQGLAEPDPFGR